jgi:ribosomal protein S18 acetylase RimI-like enzyme
MLFVATNEGGVLGTVMGGYDGHRGWVYSLAVHPDCRRQGVATKLMQYLESHLVDLGCPKLNLQVRATNQEVVSFYTSLGYQVEERVSMGKRLNGS